jgi:gluconokinase
MAASVVFMGVAGCGKSSLAAAVAQAMGLPLVEGDDFHSAANRHKMAQGTALTDQDREGWLGVLETQLHAAPDGIALTCSALKRRYRDQLRHAAPGLRFVFLDLSREAAQARVAARPGHFFGPALVDSQFETLEPPTGEPGVLRVDACGPLDQLCEQVVVWLSDTHSPPQIQVVGAKW